MKLTVELDQETDGRWIAEAVDLPGTLVYGLSRDAALAGAQALALRVVADRFEHGETPAAALDLSFVVNAAACIGLRPKDL